MENTSTFGFAHSGIVPVRGEKSDASEMCTQILVGETFKILETTSRWYKIETDFDDYRGWVNRSETSPLSHFEYTSWKRHSDRMCSRYYTYRAFSSDREALVVPPGGRVVPVDEKGGVQLPSGTYHPQKPVAGLPEGSIVETAMGYLGTPYLWGGRTDVGVDCSGLIQNVYLLYDRRIPCDSWKQEEYFEYPVEKLERAERGDIIFFNPGKEKVSHVGFYLGDGVLLHASGKVRLNTIADMPESGYDQSWYNERLAQSIHSIYRPTYETG